MKVILGLALFLSITCMSSVIEDVKYKKIGKEASVKILLDKELKDYPEILTEGNVVSVLIPNSKVKTKTVQSVTVGSESNDTKIISYQHNAQSTKVKTILPFKIEPHREQISLFMDKKVITLKFPIKKITKTIAKRAYQKKKVITKKVKSVVTKEILDEDYLASLDQNETSKVESTKKEKPAVVDSFFAKKDKTTGLTLAAKTEKPLAQKQESLKSESDSFSLLQYGGKFVAFLGIVLLLFYGVVLVLRKGVMKKGKLGFLNSTEVIQVLNTTYIGPKRSLMLIKAHKQVFLVSSTDAGISILSEITDVSGLLKDGEKSLSGNNFDDNLISAEDMKDLESKVVEKKDIQVSSNKVITEKVSFSEQLKRKAQKLKPLH